MSPGVSPMPARCGVSIPVAAFSRAMPVDLLTCARSQLTHATVRETRKGQLWAVKVCRSSGICAKRNAESLCQSEIEALLPG